MLADNGISGFLFLVGLYYENRIMATVALSCTIISTLTAVLLKFKKKNIMTGLYGYNSSLIGCALVFYFELNAYVIIAFILGSIVSTLIMEFFLRNNLPAYTFPFIFTTWILLWILRVPGVATAKLPSDTIDYKVLMDYSMPAHSFGQVLFLGDSISGLLVLIGVYIWSPVAAIYGVVSTIISAGISNYFVDVHGSAVSAFRIHSGLYGFNAVLCGIGQSGTKTIDGLYVVLSLIISTTFYIRILQLNFTGLTFPFVLSMWFCCIIKFILSNTNFISTNTKVDFFQNLKNTVFFLNIKYLLNCLNDFLKKRKSFKKQNNNNNIDNLDINLKHIITINSNNNSNIVLDII